MAKSISISHLTGRWRIVSMEQQWQRRHEPGAGPGPSVPAKL